ncbi:hypothetical protein [Rhodoferax sp.]
MCSHRGDSFAEMERLANTSGELVRLSIVDEDRLTWVAKSQQ